MSVKDEMETFDDSHRFDLLVDGELNETERRRLLTELDDEPSGWRRCALAFLEAQAWKEPFGDLIRPQDESTRDEPPRERQGPPSRPLGRFWFGGHGGTVLAMVASFLVALYLGTLIQHGPQPTEPLAPGATDMVAGTSSAGIMATPGVESPQRSDSVSPRWQMVTVSAGKDAQGNPRSFRLPVIERDQFDESWLSETSAPLPAELTEAIKQPGNEVQRRRYFIRLKMKDGRHLVVPVDEVNVRYRGVVPQ